jgi:hypothetical protein
VKQRYCYWSVATEHYAALMERCVASARRSGVFKEFHVFSDRPLEGCECYDAEAVEKTDGMFKLIYLKAGMSKLLFDYFIWIDADSCFVRNPRDVLSCLGRSPIHVPLTAKLSVKAGGASCPMGTQANGGGVTNPNPPPESCEVASQSQGEAGKDDRPCLVPNAAQYVELMTQAGIYNPVYRSHCAFWVIQRDAIDRVIELGSHFRAVAKERGFIANVSSCLGYAMQMLCANPELHYLKARPDLWASDDQGRFAGKIPKNARWLAEDEVTRECWEVNPCILHQPCARGQSADLGDLCVKEDKSSSPYQPVQLQEHAAE